MRVRFAGKDLPEYRDIGGSELTVSFIGFRIERNFLSLGQRFEALGVDGGKMNKYVVSAVVIRNKPESLFRVKPFDSACIHECTS
jgi:hypothetical protein